MYPEEQLLPLSAVGQYVYCPRRFALLHVEQQWEDNLFTAEGTVLHEKVDSSVKESHGTVRIIRSIRLSSYELGVTGIADVVEFHRVAPGEVGVHLPKAAGKWRPFPVEYKRGASKNQEAYKAQLCLQALCLEEMLHVPVPAGALFLGEKQRRFAVEFTSVLRAQVTDACHAMQRLFASGETPAAVYSKRCGSCSLLDLCQPRFARHDSVARWLAHEVSDAIDGGEDEFGLANKSANDHANPPEEVT